MGMALKLGRNAARFPVGLRWIHHYLASPLPAAPSSFDFGLKVPVDWGMLGNDQYGDCAWAGAAHLQMGAAGATNEVVPTFSDQTVITAYLNWTKGADVGTVLSDLLKAWYGQGVLGSKIGGYAPVNHHDIQHIWDATYAFDGLYIGVALPSVAQDQFQNDQPWDLTHTSDDNNIDGGHCVVLTGRNRVVSWGKEFEVSDQWLARYMDEAWAVMTPQSLARGGDGVGLDLAAMKADLAHV